MENNSKPVLVGVGAIIIDGNQKVLLTKRKGSHGEGSYGSLGGHLEYGESPTEALKREALEELGIELEQIEFLVCTNLIKYNKHYLDLTFLAKIKAGKPTIMEPDKIDLVGWFDLNDLPNPLFEPVRIGIEAYLKGENYFEINES
jgi:8-oxo-dGTP diphosphatase